MITPDRARVWHPRGALCAVCLRPTRGFGWFDPWKTKTPRPRRWFCSRPCQDLWTRRAREVFAVVDLTPEEQAAITATMRRLAELMEEIGWQTRFADLTEPQVRALIAEAVEGFRDAMAAAAAADAPEVPF